MASPLSHLIHADPSPLPGPRQPQTNFRGPHVATGANSAGGAGFPHGIPHGIPNGQQGQYGQHGQPGQHSHASPPSASRLHTPITPTGPTSVSMHHDRDSSGPGSRPSSGHSPSTNQSLTATLSTPLTTKGHATNTSLYQCADCLKRYSRPEHLQRHIATHTLGKRFICDVCGKAFGRADLLKRHRANHDDTENGVKKRRINAAPGAGRVAHACQACARARVKCEETKPCTRCRNRNLTCEFGSSEAGSAAAMHLLHLSANAHHSSVSPDPQPFSNNDHHQMQNRHIGGHQLQQQHQQHQPHQQHQQHHNPHSRLDSHNHSGLANDGDVSMAHSDNSNGSQNHPPIKTDEAQLPTPETVMMDQNHQPPDGYSQQQYVPGGSGVVDMRLPFSDFMRDVLYEELDPSRMEMAQGLAVLDFCDNSNLELNDLDFGLLDHWNGDGLMGGGDLSSQQLQQLQQLQFQSQQSQEQSQQQLQQQHQPPQQHPSLGNAAAGVDVVGGGNPSSSTATSVQDSADISSMRQKLVKVWTESPWRWDPGNLDTGWVEQSNLPIPSGEVNASHLRESQRRLDRVVSDRLESSGRDKILAIVLQTCRNNAVMTRVASSFPSVDLMDSLIHIFLASHLCQVSEWIHFGSFRLNSNHPELLACAASAGAALTPNTTLRKFGYALQEAVRVTIPSRFEDSNTRIQDIGLVQALILGQDIGMWSGNRRKMEIAECHLNIPITMMRYRGRFQRSSYPIVPLTSADEGAELEAKWAKWREQESWKRLIYHCYLRDAQMSLTTLTAPHMSYAELTLPLPESRQLWFARSAQEWQMHYLERSARESKRPPSLGDLFRDIDLLTQNHHRLDVQFALSIYLHGFWSLIWELRQLVAVQRGGSSTIFSSTTTTMGGEEEEESGGRGGGGDQQQADPETAGAFSTTTSALLRKRRQELCRVLEAFQAATHDWHELSAQESLVLNLLRMHLHVSLGDLQLFSGKEGEDQARRVYPVLQRWADSPDSRRALWHAGQILRLARLFPPGHLKDFYAIGVHHAALALWTYGIIRKASGVRVVGGGGVVLGHGQGHHHHHHHHHHQSAPSSASASPATLSPHHHHMVGGGGEVVLLDSPSETSPLIARFITYGHGRAAIRCSSGSGGVVAKQQHQHQQQQPPSQPADLTGSGNNVAFLSDPRACMGVAQEVLRANFVDGRDPLPVVVENLCQLLTQLGNAAWAVGEMEGEVLVKQQQQQPQSGMYQAMQ